MVHQVGTAERLTLHTHRLQVDAVQFLYLIHTVGIESCHSDTGQVLVLERLSLPPIEHSLVLLVGDIHQGGESLLVVRRHQSVDITKLHDRTNLLILSYRLATELLLGIRHVLGLYLHSQSSAHRHVDTVFQCCRAEHGVVGGGGDMTCHGDGREEIAGAPLHIDTLEGIGIVADPELVEVGEYAPVGTSTARGTCLNSDIRELGTDALAYLLETAMVLDIHVALVVHRQVL